MTDIVRKKKTIAYHLYTIWLFTSSDIKSVIIPETALGLASALSGNLLTTNPTPNLLTVLARTPQIVLWNWLNLLLFDVDNQFQPNSILEDSVNKPWRAIPSHRLAAAQARHLLLVIIPVVFLATLHLGGTREAVTLMIMTWMYNDLGGADIDVVIRNLLNGLGYMCYGSGSMVVAAGFGHHRLNETANSWLMINGAIIFTTLQMQDMPDVKGDAARNRKTIPLVYGDAVARYSIVVPVLAWSVICPAFWGMGPHGYIAPVFVGAWLAFRLLVFRSVAADGETWKVWCLWMMTIYLLPLCKEYSALVRFWDTWRQS